MRKESVGKAPKECCGAGFQEVLEVERLSTPEMAAANMVGAFASRVLTDRANGPANDPSGEDLHALCS